MFGTTEEVFFANWDLAIGKKDNAVAQKIYTTFNPATLVDKWNTLFLFSGGKRFVYQLVRARSFQAAQPIRYKSRFVYFPEEPLGIATKHKFGKIEFF
jgi:hypothetical protein